LSIEYLKRLVVNIADKTGICPDQFGLIADVKQSYKDTCTGNCRECWMSALRHFKE
jgi:hypothetical protein